MEMGIQSGDPLLVFYDFFPPKVPHFQLLRGLSFWSDIPCMYAIITLKKSSKDQKIAFTKIFFPINESVIFINKNGMEFHPQLLCSEA